jgi:hypothetical protein
MKKILLVAVVFAFAGGCRGDGLLSPNVLTYSGTSRVAPVADRLDHPLAVQATVVITNTNDRPITFNYERSVCFGFQLHAFATSDMSGAPVWNSNQPGQACALLGYLPSPLQPGESVQLGIYGLVQDILGADRANGTYYFDVVLPVGGGEVRSSTVHIPAGSVFLAR